MSPKNELMYTFCTSLAVLMGSLGKASLSPRL